MGQRMLKLCDIDDGSIHVRHYDQVQFNESQDDHSTIQVPDGEDANSTNTENEPILRRSKRIQERNANPPDKITCGGCAENM